MRLTRPTAILFDVGDTLLEERWFDLDAGIDAVVPNDAIARSLADEFRVEIAQRHAKHTEPLLAEWLQRRVLERFPDACLAPSSPDTRSENIYSS